MEKNIYYMIYVYIVYFIKFNYTYNINILNIILQAYDHFFVFKEH